MKTIQGVLGPISPDTMGVTLPHEHLTTVDWSMRMNFGSRIFDQERVLARAVEQVNRAKAVGVKTIVDATPINLGRDVHLIRQVSRITGVNFICSSGFYAQEEPWLHGQSSDDIYNWLTYEVKNGISGTDTFPGQMKAAVGGNGITPHIERMLHITARVAVENDLPLFCHHTVSLKNGLDILKIFESEGMELGRVALGHCGDTDDIGYLKEILSTGCYIGNDRFAYGAEFGNDTAGRIQDLVTLCELGYTNRILVSHDAAVYLCFFEDQEPTLSNHYLYKDYADYTYIFREILPRFKRAGFTDQDVEQLTVKNPRKFFTGE